MFGIKTVSMYDVSSTNGNGQSTRNKVGALVVLVLFASTQRTYKVAQ